MKHWPWALIGVLALSAFGLRVLTGRAIEANNGVILSTVSTCKGEDSATKLVMIGSSRLTLTDGTTVQLIPLKAKSDFEWEGGYDLFMWRDSAGQKRKFYIMGSDDGTDDFGMIVEKIDGSLANNTNLYERFDFFYDCSWRFVWF